MNKEQLRAQMQQLHKEGRSIREIARETGTSKSSVGRMVKEFQDPGPGTAAGICPVAAAESSRTALGKRSEGVPTAGLSPSGTTAVSQNSGHNAEPASPPEQQDYRAFEELMAWTHRQSLQSSYRDFLYNTRTFLTGNLSSERLARELMQSRQKRVSNYIQRARGYCSSCGVNYEGLFMAYVLRELYLFLAQQPELEETKWELKVKSGPVLEQFLKQAERLDVFTPMEPYMACFPAIDILR